MHKKKMIFAFISFFFFLLILVPFYSQAQPYFARTQKQLYSPNEEIIVEFGGLPGSSGDWITIVEKDYPSDRYGQWFYTEGKREGTLTFKGLNPGDYEVRLYLDWPQGGYNIKYRHSFLVSSGGEKEKVIETPFFELKLK